MMIGEQDLPRCICANFIPPQRPTAETQLSSRVPEIPEIDNESAGNEYGPVYLSGAP